MFDKFVCQEVARHEATARVECQVTGAVLVGRLRNGCHPDTLFVDLKNHPATARLNNNLTRVQAVSFDNGFSFIDLLPVEPSVL